MEAMNANVTLHKCDYCGGWEAKNEGFADIVIDYQVTYYDDNIMRVSRSICWKCFVKVFDTVLGEPKFTELRHGGEGAAKKQPE